MLGKSTVVCQGMAEGTCTNDDDVPILIELQDALERGDERLDLIPQARRAELTKVREVLANLGRSDSHPLPKLCR